MTTLLQITNSSVVVTTVEVPICNIKNSEYFMGFMSCCNDGEPLLFPPQYQEVAHIYVSFITNDNYNKHGKHCNIGNITSDQLKRSFELCHYLIDQILFTHLMDNYLLDQWFVHNHIIDELSDNIQRDIYLRCPWDLIPDKFSKCHPGTDQPQHKDFLSFFYAWYRINKDYDYTTKTISINFGNIKYYSHIRIHSKDVIQSIESRCSVNGDKYKHHGIEMYLHEPDDEGNQPLLGEVRYDRGKVASCEKQWRRNGTLTSIRQHTDTHCIYSEYYESGKQKFIIMRQYHNDDSETGTWKHWYPSGNIMWELPYVDGNRHGIHRKYFDIDGKTKNKIECEYHFDNNVEVGTHRVWTLQLTPTGNRRQLKWECAYSADNTYVYKEYNHKHQLMCNFSSNSDDAPQRYRNKKFTCLYDVEEVGSYYYKFSNIETDSDL